MIYDEKFEDWFKTYPRKAGKNDAAKAFHQIRADDLDGVREILMTNTPLQIAAWEAEGRAKMFIPYPATYLRSGDWTEPPEGMKPVGYEEDGVYLEISE